MKERGALDADIVNAIEKGEKYPAKFNRTGFRRNFINNRKWLGKEYSTKQIEGLAVWENNGWLVITVIVRYF
jgi:hypothetical protein